MLVTSDSLIKFYYPKDDIRLNDDTTWKSVLEKIAPEKVKEAIRQVENPTRRDKVFHTLHIQRLPEQVSTVVLNLLQDKRDQMGERLERLGWYYPSVAKAFSGLEIHQLKEEAPQLIEALYDLKGTHNYGICLRDIWSLVRDLVEMEPELSGLAHKMGEKRFFSLIEDASFHGFVRPSKWNPDPSRFMPHMKDLLLKVANEAKQHQPNSIRGIESRYLLKELFADQKSYFS